MIVIVPHEAKEIKMPDTELFVSFLRRNVCSRANIISELLSKEF